ncbi:hypothetical protein [Streptomyces sp. NPDC054834]
MLRLATEATRAKGLPVVISLQESLLIALSTATTEACQRHEVLSFHPGLWIFSFPIAASTNFAIRWIHASALPEGPILTGASS